MVKKGYYTTKQLRRAQGYPEKKPGRPGIVCGGRKEGYDLDKGLAEAIGPEVRRLRIQNLIGLYKLLKWKIRRRVKK